MQKHISVAASTLIQLCLGGVYAWSTFVPMLKKQFGYTTVQTQTIFATTLMCFAFSMIFSGRLERKIGPQKVAIIGAVLLYCGYFFASLSGGNFIYICLSIGVLCGVGTGFGYVCCLVVPAKNFPQNKGLATGISVGGFGAGAILLTYVVKYLQIQQPDISVLSIFQTLGYIYGVIIIIGTFYLKYEGAGKQSLVTNSFSSSVLLKDKNYWILFLTMFSGCFAGLQIIGNAKPIVLALNFSDNAATICILILSLGNMIGRVVWGLVIDKIGVDKSLYIAYSILLTALISLNFIANSELMVSFTILLVGIGYSSCMVLFAAKTMQIYGVDKYGIVYPFVFMAFGFAGVFGPIVAGLLFDINKSYFTPILISVLITSFGLGIYYFNKIDLKKTE